MDIKKGLKIPVQIRVNMWLGLATEEKKFNNYAEGMFNVFAELVKIFFLCFEVWRDAVMNLELIMFIYSMRTRLRFWENGAPPVC